MGKGSDGGGAVAQCRGVNVNRDTLLRRIEKDESDIVALCRQLTRISSENPPGDTKEIAGFLEALLREKGLEPRVYAPRASMPNIVARIEGGEPGRRLVLNGHIDTYPAGDRDLWERDPFGGELEGGRLFGRGVADMKAGDAASLMTFFYLAENRERMKGKVILSLVSDEETGGRWGTDWLLDNVAEMHGDAVLNGEPSACDLVNFGEKGPLWIEVTSRGRAAHGAYTHAGSNAIENLNRFLGELQALESLGVAPGDVARTIEEGRDVVEAVKGTGATENLTRITVNVGRITGGLKINLVPDHAKAEVDIRLPLGAESKGVLGEIESIRARHPGMEYRVLHVIEPNHTPVVEEIVVLTRRNAEAVRGRRVFLSAGIGYTDCRLFRRRGIPCAVYGPRSYNMGGPNEFIEVADLMDTVKVHAMTAFEYLECLD